MRVKAIGYAEGRLSAQGCFYGLCGQTVRRLLGCPIAQFGMCAADAQALAADKDKPAEIYAFSAAWTDRPLPLLAGKIGIRDGNLHPTFPKQLVNWEFAIGVHLPAALALDFREQAIRSLTGAVEGDDPDGPLILDINECRCHFAPVSEFQRAFAEPAAGYKADGICSATVDFDVSEKALAVSTMRVGYC